MRNWMVLGAAIGMGATVYAQAPVAPAFHKLATSAQIAELAQQAKAKTDATHPTANLPALSSNGFTMNVEYHAGVGLAAVHDNDAELMYVYDGSGTIVTGGTLHNPKRTNATNETGTAIDGGTARHVQKGDWILVDRAEPHFWSQLDGPMIVVSIHLPAH